VVSKLILIFFLIFIAGLMVSPYFQKKELQVCFKDHCFIAELALAREEKRQGLMFRKSLEENRGMLFVYEKEEMRSFWMKNVLIPLDIIWLDQDKKVVHISENAQPCLELPCPSLKPNSPVKYVFEINGGLASEIGLVVGDKLEFQIR